MASRGVGTHHGQKRAEIADAVLTVVAERGLQTVSLTEVAATAGVSPGRVQHYFATRHELLNAAFERGNEASAARIRDKAGGNLDAAPAREVLTIVLTELIAYDAASRAHLRVRQWFNALALADDTIAERLRAQYADFHRQMAALLRRDQQAGVIAENRDPHAIAVDLVALAEGLGSNVLIGVYPARTARRQVLAAVDVLYS